VNYNDIDKDHLFTQLWLKHLQTKVQLEDANAHCRALMETIDDQADIINCLCDVARTAEEDYQFVSRHYQAQRKISAEWSDKYYKLWQSLANLVNPKGV
jgi:hypothetical protein